MPYSEDEIQAAVERVLDGQIRRSSGATRELDINQSFRSYQDAAARAFVTDVHARFHVIGMARNRTNELVTTQAATVRQLLEAVRDSRNRTVTVEDLSELHNARQALRELERSALNRQDSFRELETVPAFRRYASNVQSFLDGTSRALVQNGDVRDTSQSVRARIPGLVRQLQDNHRELRRRVTLLAGAVQELERLNLPASVAEDILRRAGDVLDENFDELEDKTPAERAQYLRGLTLALLTQLRLVERFGGARAPTAFLRTTGNVSAYSDALHPAGPAALQATIPGPYAVLPEDDPLEVLIDGVHDASFKLSGSFVAELNGTMVEPFVIDATNDQLVLEHDSYGAATPERYVLTLTHGTVPAEDVADELNGQLTLESADLVVEPYFLPLKYDAPVSVTDQGGDVARFTVLGGSLSGLNIQVGDLVEVRSGPDADTYWVVTELDPSGQWVDASGDSAPSEEPDVEIRIGPPDRALRIRDTDPAASLAVRRTLAVIRTEDPVENLTASTLGFFPGISVTSRPVSAGTLAQAIELASPQMGAQAAFQPDLYDGQAYSVPGLSTRVRISRWRGDVEMTSGMAVAMVAPVLLEPLVEVGDVVVIRESSDPADVGVQGTVDSVDEFALEVSFPHSVTGGTVLIDVGPPVGAGFGATLRVLAGPNEGSYRVDSLPAGASDLDVELEGVLPAPVEAGRAVEFPVELGREYLELLSRTEQTGSAVEVDGDTAMYFFEEVPASAGTRTSWVRFDSFPREIQVGDLLQVYEESRNTPAATHTVVGVDSSLRLIQVEPPVSADFQLSVAANQALPFARIQVGQLANYDELKTGAQAWLEQSGQQDAYWRELARLLNPILTEPNPSVLQANDAYNHLTVLAGQLTREFGASFGDEGQTLEAALDAYQAPVSESVDDLIAALRQKGADRAIDILLECRFQDFFNLGLQGVSYSGELTRATQELNREDLPIRRYNRPDRRVERQLASIPDQPDHEYVIDEDVVADPPAAFDE